CQECLLCFQAEDGIRDWSVTGVQTCALPICVDDGDERSHDKSNRHEEQPGQSDVGVRVIHAAEDRLIIEEAVEPSKVDAEGQDRSEERRVGKGWRSRWWRAD